MEKVLVIAWFLVGQRGQGKGVVLVEVPESTKIDANFAAREVRKAFFRLRLVPYFELMDSIGKPVERVQNDMRPDPIEGMEETGASIVFELLYDKGIDEGPYQIRRYEKHNS